MKKEDLSFIILRNDFNEDYENVNVIIKDVPIDTVGTGSNMEYYYDLNSIISALNSSNRIDMYLDLIYEIKENKDNLYLGRINKNLIKDNKKNPIKVDIIGNTFVYFISRDFVSIFLNTFFYKKRDYVRAILTEFINCAEIKKLEPSIQYNYYKSIHKVVFYNDRIEFYYYKNYQYDEDKVIFNLTK